MLSNCVVDQEKNILLKVVIVTKGAVFNKNSEKTYQIRKRLAQSHEVLKKNSKNCISQENVPLHT